MQDMLMMHEQGQAQKADGSRRSGEAESGCFREREGSRYDADEYGGAHVLVTSNADVIEDVRERRRHRGVLCALEVREVRDPLVPLHPSVLQHVEHRDGRAAHPVQVEGVRPPHAAAEHLDAPLRRR